MAPTSPRRADTLLNDVLLSDGTRTLRRRVRQFADDVVRPEAHRLNTMPDSRDGFVRTLRGSDKDYPLQSIYRDAEIGEIYEGANELQRGVVAPRIFGRDITG